MSNDYPYKDMNITTAIAKELILQHLIGKSLITSDIREQIGLIHTTNGGSIDYKTSLKSAVKYALRQLGEELKANWLSEGYWHINDPNNPVIYMYEGLSLTVAVARALLIQFYEGETFKRKEAIDQISQYHIEQGGTPGDDDYYISSYKGALKYLERKGMAYKPKYGYGHIYDIDTGIGEDIDLDDELDSDDSEESSEHVQYIEKTIGNGSESVYVYYFPSDKELAQLKNNPYYPCKIGHTTTDPQIRVYEQMHTANHEAPNIALVINTDKPKILEATIMNIFKMRNKYIDAPRATEWVISNPSEIESIYEYLCKDIPNDFSQTQ